jgi:hypothetical protein
MKSIFLKKDRQNPLKLYDEFGRFKYHIVVSNLIELFFISIVYQLIFLIYHGKLTVKIAQLENLIVDYINIQKFFYSNIINFDFFTHTMQLFLLPIYVTCLYLIYALYQFQKSTLARKLNKLGLEDYKVIKKNKEEIVLRSKKYEEIDIDDVINEKDNIKQLFKIKKEILITRYKTDCIKIEVEKELPKLINFDSSKFEKNKIHLGIKLVDNKKFIDSYLDFDSLLHTAILGSTGQGKSVFLNYLILNIFYNIHLLHMFYFIDFKGGIEAKIYKRLNKDNVITCGNDLKKLYEILKDIYSTNEKRMKILESSNLKKWKGEYIFLVFDEFAQILMYTPKNQEEKEILKDINFILNNLFSTGRSQNIRIIYSTQSFVKEASNIPNVIKVNTTVKFMFRTTASTSISSVIIKEDLDELQLNPKLLNKGESLIIDAEDVDTYKFKTVFVEDNKLNEILSLVMNESDTANT